MLRFASPRWVHCSSRTGTLWHPINLDGGDLSLKLLKLVFIGCNILFIEIDQPDEFSSSRTRNGTPHATKSHWIFKLLNIRKSLGGPHLWHDEPQQKANKIDLISGHLIQTKFRSIGVFILLGQICKISPTGWLQTVTTNQGGSLRPFD